MTGATTNALHTPTRGAPATRRAFTVVEMLLVLVLIGALTGGVVVSLRGRRGEYALRTASQDLAAAIRFAAGQAQAGNVPHRVAFESDRRTYRVEVAADDDGSRFAPVGGRMGHSKSLGRAVEVVEVRVGGRRDDSMLSSLEFGRRGAGFSGSIKLQNDAGETRWIDVTPEVRQVHVRP